jgi:hypothetical protein
MSKRWLHVISKFYYVNLTTLYAKVRGENEIPAIVLTLSPKVL